MINGVMSSLECRRQRADLIEVRVHVNKMMHNIDKIITDKDKLFTFPTYTVTKGHQLKLAKKQHRLKIQQFKSD